MTSQALVLGIDQSTQGTKALLLDDKGNIIDKCALPHRQIINDKGYVEHDLKEIAHNVLAVVKKLCDNDKSRASNIVTVGLSVQRETVCAYSRSTCEPLYNAIVWQCARGRDFVMQKEIQDKKDEIRKITGLELSEYFSAAKATWLIDNVPLVQEYLHKKALCIGNIDAFLVSFLTNGENFYTDPSNASRTQLMDLKNLQWSSSLCDLFHISEDCLPEIVDTDSKFGMTDFGGILPKKIPIYCAIGDSQGALFGQACLNKGQTKVTYGTGSSIMMNSGSSTQECLHGIVNSVGFRRNKETTYVLEGNINYSAGVISWLKDNLKLISDPKETEQLAKDSNPMDRTYMVPAFSGLGAPYFNGDVRGSFVGMSRVTGKNEIVRAALDSIVYQVNDVLDLIKKSSNIDLSLLFVDGGATGNNYLMQRQADISNITVKVASNAELSGMGAAFIAGIAAGVYDESLLFENRYKASYSPNIDSSLKGELIGGWKKAVSATINFGS